MKLGQNFVKYFVRFLGNGVSGRMLLTCSIPVIILSEEQTAVPLTSLRNPVEVSTGILLTKVVGFSVL